MKRIIILIITLLIIPLNIKAFETSSSAGILMDMDSKRIFYSNNIHEKRRIASITKIMTAIVTIENININKTVTIGSEIEGAYGSGIYIKKGETLTIKDLLYGLMLRSGNDAALAIAYNVAGSNDNFVKLMNDKTIKIGMKNTIFNNPHGLDGDKSNYSTAYDMALLTSYAMKNSIYREITNTKKYKLKTNMNVYSWTNKNKLLFSNEYVTGGKTGFTELARRTLVTTASKDNFNLVAVTLNDGNDFLDHSNLYKEAYENYKNYKILSKGNINIVDDKFYKEKNLYIKNNFYYPLDETEKNNVILKINLSKKRNYSINDKIGYVDVYLGDKKIYNEAIYVGENKKETNSILDTIRNWFK